MNIEKLPYDCFYHIQRQLSIDERNQARPAFQSFDACFQQLYNVAKNSKSIGIDSLDVQSILNPLTKKLYNRFSLNERWRCSNLDHIPQECFTSNKSFNQICKKCDQLSVLCIIKHCSNLESLDIRGITITVSLLKGILKYCSKICCFRLNFSTFENEESFEIFVNELAPKISHLSCDNLLINTPDGFSRFFSNVHNLNEMEIVIYPNENLKPNDLSLIISENVDFLFLRFYRTKNKRLTNDPSRYICCLNEGKAKTVPFFKIKSNYNYELNYDLFLELKNLNCLKAINLSFMNYYQPSLDFKLQNCWPMLESLTLDLFGLRGSNELLLTLVDGCFKNTLQYLRLLDCNLRRRALNNLPKFCPNLISLQLVDITFKNIGIAFEKFSLFKNLKTLHIEYSLKENSFDPQSLLQLVESYSFSIDDIPKVKRFFESHNSLERVYFIDWPGMKRDFFSNSIQNSKGEKIFLFIKEY